MSSRTPLSSLFGRDPAMYAALIVMGLLLAITLLIMVGIVVLPIIILLGIAKAIHWYVKLPPKTSVLAQAVSVQKEAANFPTVHEFMKAIDIRYENDCKAAGVTPAGYNVLRQLLECAIALYEAENFSAKRPPLRHVIEGGVADGEYRDSLLQQAKKLENPERTVAVFSKILSHAFLRFTETLPAQARDTVDREDAAKAGTSLFLTDLMPDTRQAVENLFSPFFHADADELGLFRGLRKQLQQNLTAINDDDLVMPTDAEFDAFEAIDAYLIGTPLLPLFAARIPWQVPEEMRWEHQWIVAPQGAGKTVYMQHQLIRDIEKVANDEASVVVMDSQGDLLRLVSGLKAIPEEKLIIIEPDPEYPLALNLFDLGKSRGHDARTRQMLDTNAIDLITYIFDGLLGTETTPKQSTLLRHSVRLCRAIPGATIQTLIDIFATRGVPHPEVLAKLPEPTQDFFTTLFTDAKQFSQTRQEVGWRLSLMLEKSDALARMFSAKSSRLDLFTELNSSKFICINTDKSLFKDEGTELFGRFWLAMLLQAAQERALIEKQNRLPTYVYIDEAQDYIAHDTRNISTLLDQARKMAVGLVLANQRTAQMDAKVLDALTNVSIKCARAVSDAGAHTLARNMATTPDFIQKQPVGSFAVSLRNQPAMSIKIPYGEMEKMERRTAGELYAIRQRMRAKYASVPILQDHTETEPRPMAEPVFPTDDDDPDNRPTTWR